MLAERGRPETAARRDVSGGGRSAVALAVMTLIRAPMAARLVFWPTSFTAQDRTFEGIRGEDGRWTCWPGGRG